MGRESAQQLWLLWVARIGDDHAFATPKRQSCDSAFVSHAFGKPQHIRQRLFLGSIGVHPAWPPAAGPKAVDMKRDDRFQPNARIVAKDYLLMPASKSG